MHFTFSDGALGYDCIRCGARCCHGLGFSMRQEELIPFLGKAPKMAPFLQIRKGFTDAFDLTDGCWLLETDGRCGVEVRDGRDAKPAVCRLFPLQPRRIAGELIVDIKLLSCPVQDAKELGPQAAVVRHAEAAAEVAELGEAFARNDNLPPGAPDDLLVREARIRDAAAELLDSGDSATLIARAHQEDEAELTGLRARWRRWLEVEPGLDAARSFGLVLSSLRMAAITAPGAPPWPRLSRALPRQLLAASFYMELSALAGRPSTLRGIAEVWRSTASVRQLLARWTDKPRALADDPVPSGIPAEIVEAYDAVAGSQAPIGEALEATSLATHLRPLLLRLVADRSL